MNGATGNPSSFSTSLYKTFYKQCTHVLLSMKNSFNHVNGNPAMLNFNDFNRKFGMETWAFSDFKAWIIYLKVYKLMKNIFL
jgi:hypothetical protein